MLIFPPVFDWKDGKMPDTFKPRCHIFYGTRTFDIEDGVPKFEGMKEKSDTLPEVEGDSDEDEANDSKQPEPKQAASTTNGTTKGTGKNDASTANGTSNGTAAPTDSIAADVKRQRRSG